MIQQEIGCQGFGKDVVSKSNMRKERVRYRSGHRWGYRNQYDPSLHYLYEIITGWPSLPLLFVRGAGVLKKKKRTKPQKPRKKRRKFGDEEDSEDEAWIPKVGISIVMLNLGSRYIWVWMPNLLLFLRERGRQPRMSGTPKQGRTIVFLLLFTKWKASLYCVLKGEALLDIALAHNHTSGDPYAWMRSQSREPKTNKPTSCQRAALYFWKDIVRQTRFVVWATTLGLQAI